MYFVYLLCCSDNSLYTGITQNLDKRMKLHALGKGSKYVSSRLPFKLIYTEKLRTKSEALRREYEIKRWDRNKKIKELNLHM